jgi:hypothetical protein
LPLNDFTAEGSSGRAVMVLAFASTATDAASVRPALVAARTVTVAVA